MDNRISLLLSLPQLFPTRSLQCVLLRKLDFIKSCALSGLCEFVQRSPLVAYWRALAHYFIIYQFRLAANRVSTQYLADRHAVQRDKEKREYLFCTYITRIITRESEGEQQHEPGYDLSLVFRTSPPRDIFSNQAPPVYFPIVRFSILFRPFPLYNLFPCTLPGWVVTRLYPAHNHDSDTSFI